MNGKFEPTNDMIRPICRFFDIGELKGHKKLIDDIALHTNPLLLVTTSKGLYVLKFYPSDHARAIRMEFNLNRIMTDHQFPTPIMFTGQSDRPYWPIQDKLVTCFTYIDGDPASKHIKKPNVIRWINASMLSLKNILSSVKGSVPLKSQASFTSTTRDLAKASRALAPYAEKKIIDQALRDSLHSYQLHRHLFHRRWLHYDTALPNFIIHKAKVYTLDLEHVQEDYALGDLRNLVISCLSFNIPSATIKTAIKDYLKQHRLGEDHFPVLNALIKARLVREFLKNIQRGKTYQRPCFAQRQRSIITQLNRMTDDKKLIFQ